MTSIRSELGAERRFEIFAHNSQRKFGKKMPKLREKIDTGFAPGGRCLSQVATCVVSTKTRAEFRLPALGFELVLSRRALSPSAHGNLKSCRGNKARRAFVVSSSLQKAVPSP
jgi:hypothetical protein